MNDDLEEYIAYRHDKYSHANPDSKLDAEFPENKDLPDNGTNSRMTLTIWIGISFKRVKRQEEPLPADIVSEDEDGGDDARDESSDDGEPQRFVTPIIGITAFFAIKLIVGPFLVRKGPNRGIVQCSIMLTAFCMWIFWVTVYIGQMNPLMGPRLDNTSVAWIAFKLGNPVKPLKNSDDGN